MHIRHGPQTAYLDPHLGHAQPAGGQGNGSTSHDSTVYWEQAPANALEQMIFAEATRSGAIEEEERVLMTGIMRLADRPVRELMTPRTELDWIDASGDEADVLAEILPVWRRFPGALAIHVTFAEDRDEGAPEYPLILAIDWPDRATVDAFLAHPIRKEGRAATEAVLSRAFEPLFSTKSNGSGFGLASVLEFAREMGGDARLESAPGKVPVAGLDGKVDFDYLPLAQQNAVLAEAIVSATHENLRDFFDDREVKAQVQTHTGQITTLTTRVTTEVARRPPPRAPSPAHRKGSHADRPICWRLKPRASWK